MGVVTEPLLTGCEAFVLSHSQLKRMEICLIRKLRAMMLGKAKITHYDEDGWETGITTKSNLQVLRHWRLPPVAVELMVRRLAMFQELVRHKTESDN